MVIEKQGILRKSKRCVDQLFPLKMLVEEYLRKGKELDGAFMGLEKVYDRVDKEALWNILWCRCDAGVFVYPLYYPHQLPPMQRCPRIYYGLEITTITQLITSIML